MGRDTVTPIDLSSSPIFSKHTSIRLQSRKREREQADITSLRDSFATLWKKVPICVTYKRCSDIVVPKRAFLCREDALSGGNYDHRKEWILDRLTTLADVFAIRRSRRGCHQPSCLCLCGPMAAPMSNIGARSL